MTSITKKCSVESCDVKRYGRQPYCNRHYQKNCKYGDPLHGKEYKMFGKHGLSRTPEYYSWHDMIRRCNDPRYTNYHSYGGRGIKVCQRWLDSPTNFYADMGERLSPTHTLDRINNDGDYEPSNCRWATKKEQRANQRPKKMQANNTSGYIGVHFNKVNSKWVASIKRNSKTKYLGYFATAEEAHIAREKELTNYTL